MHSSRRLPAREAAMIEPTDWAAVGARVLDAVCQAVAMHMAKVARLKAEGAWPEPVDGRQSTVE